MPDTRRRVYFANHTSHLDFVVLWAVLPRVVRRCTRPVAARDYWERGPLRRWLARRVFRAVLIEREHITQSCNPLEPLAEALRAGESLILFPEGTRHCGPDIGEFKSGLYHLLRVATDAEAVPVYIENLNRVLPKGETLLVPFLCSVTFGDSHETGRRRGQTPVSGAGT